MQEKSSLHAFQFPSIDGGMIDFAVFKGKKVLVVNTASDCMYTDQYKQLQELSVTYPEKLVVVGFPSNDFGEQEPGTDKEIRNFCSYRYGVTFPLASKSSVIGADANPVFKWLTGVPFEGDANREISWNFQKFLCDEDGRLIDVFSPAADPINDSLLGHIHEN
jgi:glutathione peroxidase